MVAMTNAPTAISMVHPPVLDSLLNRPVPDTSRPILAQRRQVAL